MTDHDDLLILRDKPFVDHVLKFEELMAQSGRAFLIGAGCSKCAGLPLTDELTENALTNNFIDETTRQIFEALKNLFNGATDANIEDYLSELIDILAIAERRKTRGAVETQITLGTSFYDADQLQNAVEQIKRGIVSIIDIKVVIDVHQSFIKAVHRPLRPGKLALNQPVDYLVLNYDTLIEDALALERLPFADGLDGGVTGWWNPLTFDRKELVARVFKLHGSINWCEFPGDPFPRRVGDRLQVIPTNDRRILIWPASTKYRETQLDPYAQLSERVRQVLRPSHGAQCVLLVCGYRFGDSHINIEIDRALRETEGRLTVIAFTSENEPSGQLKKWNEDFAVSEQVLIFAKRGFFHGTQASTATNDLPWWKFENITRLLGGER